MPLNRRFMNHRPLSHRLQRPIQRLAIMAMALVPLACTSIFPVAVILPETGAWEAYGVATRQGIELALEELQAAGEADHLRVDFFDSQSDPAMASQQLDEALSGDTLVAIGGITAGEASAMVEVAEAKKRVLLSPSSSNERLSQEGGFFYRLAIPDSTAGSSMADFSSRELKLDKVLLLAGDADLLRGLEAGFRPAFESAGGTVVDAVEIPQDDDTLATLVNGPEVQAVYLNASPNVLGDTIQRLRQQGFGGRILTTETLASPAALERIGKDAVGVVLTQTVLTEDDTNPRAKAFIESYRQKYDQMPDIFAAQAYDAMYVLAHALKGRPAIESSVRKGLRDEIKDFNGVTGMIQFNSSGSINRYPRVYRVAEDLSLSDYARELKMAREAMELKRQELLDRLSRIGTGADTSDDSDADDEGDKTR